jgi:hypothetical protein
MNVGEVALGFFTLGCLCSYLFTRALVWAQEHKPEISDDQARAILKKHDLRPDMYFATAGVVNQELRAALDVIAPPAYLILDNENRLFGGVGGTEPLGPKIRLVVDNDQR